MKGSNRQPCVARRTRSFVADLLEYNRRSATLDQWSGPTRDEER